MSKSVKWLIAILIAITVASVVAVSFMAAHRPDSDEGDEEEAVKTPARISVQNGRTFITLDPQTEAREGIRVAAVRQSSMHAELHGTAVLLPVADLATLRNAYLVARTKLRRDQVDLQLLQNQYARIKTLYEENQNMSLKAMEGAQAAYRNSQAQIEADKQDAQLQLDNTRQRWGPVVAGWIKKQSLVLEPVLEQREFLAQVVFPPGELAKPPARLSLIAPGNRPTPARFVSSLPVVNPQIQGVSFLYAVPNRPGMAIGLNLSVLVPVGSFLQGTTIPESAITWWQGRAWVYEESSPNVFARREVPTSNPVPSGYFVPGATFPRGSRLVTAGAQALLSEEFHSQTQQEE